MLILVLFVLTQGEAEVMHALITGSIIGTSLLRLGLAIVAGSVGRERQTLSASGPRCCPACSSCQ